VEQNVRRALEIVEIADRGYVLVSGRIVKEAKIEELFFREARPRT